MKTVLVVDDEQDIVDLLSYNLEKAGYAVWTASNGNDALRMAGKQPDLCILDVMMPGMDGWDVCKTLRQDPATAGIPVMFLTARDDEVDEVVGLEIGADDYLTKPIRMRTLLARVKKVLSKQRRSVHETDTPSALDAGGITIETDNYAIRVGNRSVRLPRKEFEVLLYLVRHSDRVVSREVLLNEIWGKDIYVGDRTVDVRIRKIREKLGKHARRIETVKGVGYRFRSEK